MNHYLLFGAQLYALAALRPLQGAIRERGDRAAWYISGPARRYLRPGERRLDSVAAVKRYAPCAVFVSGNVVPDFFPGLKVEIFHGFHVRKRSPARGHYRLRGFFDLYCTQGPDTTRNFERLAARHGYFEVVETGWPKMDPLFAKTAAPARTARPVVLLTSTFTPRLSCAAELRETVRRLASTGRWRWVATFHPKMDPAVIGSYRAMEGEHFRLVETDDVVSLLKEADVMVSDTSSILSEFLLQRRPVVTFRNRRPGPHLLDISEPDQLERAIALALTKPPKLMAAIRRYGDHIHPYRDGRSSQRVLAAADNLITRGRGHLRRKPLNLLRRVKIRRELGYYRWR
jgi:CDP-glycerol glycerophosphotransferase (TagB/SpsB family)